jgi:hypothetical protein
MTVAQWLAIARADAERRGLADLVPVLETLAGAIAAVRARTPGADGPPDPGTAHDSHARSTASD